MKKVRPGHIVLISIVIILICFPVLIYKSFGKPYYFANELFLDESLCVLRNKDGLFSIFNPKSLKMVLKRAEVSDCGISYADSAGVFKHNKRCGYYDITTGEVFVRPQFSRAWAFSEGLAAVKKDGLIGFINRKGDIAIDFRFPYYGNTLSDVTFIGGHCVVSDRNGLVGVIDTTGKWVIKPEYHSVEIFNDYAIVNSSGIRKQVGFDGKTINSFVVENVEELTYMNSDGSFCDDEDEGDDAYEDDDEREDKSCRKVCQGLYVYQMGDLYGLMDTSGRRLTEPLYTGISAIGDGLIKAALLDDYSEVILNFEGDVLN